MPVIAGVTFITTDRRQYFLRALAHIMHSVPKQVLLGELPSVRTLWEGIDVHVCIPYD